MNRFCAIFAISSPVHGYDYIESFRLFSFYFALKSRFQLVAEYFRAESLITGQISEILIFFPSHGFTKTSLIKAQTVSCVCLTFSVSSAKFKAFSNGCTADRYVQQTYKSGIVMSRWSSMLRLHNFKLHNRNIYSQKEFN